MTVENQLLRSYFSPQKIAFIGASEQGIYPAGIMQNLIDHGFSDRVFPVNPNRTHVFGLRCYESVLDLPDKPDLALLTVPRKAVISVLKECIRFAIPAVLVITAGFGESDAYGVALQKQLEALIRNNPIRLIGPNCAGLASFPNGFIATRLYTETIPGHVAFVSQSGALMMSLHGLFSDRHIGLSRLVSLGNQADVSIAEMINALVVDPETDVITVFMEGLSRGEQLTNAFKHALEVGKPIILLKTGRTSRGMAVAATHTAALAGEDRIFKAICDQFGVIYVDDIEDMMDVTQVAAALGAKLAGINTFGFISQSGGMGSLTADWIEYTQIDAPPLSNDLKSDLYALGTVPEYAVLLNPADVRGASVRGKPTADTLRVFMNDPGFDAIIMLFARPLQTQGAIETAKAIISRVKDTKKPVLVVWSGQRSASSQSPSDNACDHLQQADIPVFPQPSSLLKAIQKLQHYWRYREIWLENFSRARQNEE